MRQLPSRADEPRLFIRSLAVDYAAGGREDVHVHPWPQFLYARSGAVRAEIGGRSWTIPPRRGLWIPAYTPHSLRMSSRLELRTLYLRPDKAGSARPACVVDVSGLLHEAILRVCEQGHLDERIDTDRSLGSIILSEMTCSDPGRLVLSHPKDPRARRLADFFFDPALHDVALDALYALAGLSRRTAERVFQRECGLSPAQWRRFSALSEGLVSIAGGASIEHAAAAIGYQSRSAFSEAFSLAFGFPPSQAGKS